MSFKKIDKEFCWTDDSVNVYGYRCLTSGLLLDEVKKNPIGFRMHNRDGGIIVRWEDFRIDGDRVFAKPVINLSHPDGKKTVDEIENGFLNAASAGKIVCLEASDESSLKKSGQTAPTVTKWFPREISLVDIPGNYNALAKVYNIDNKELSLSDMTNPTQNNSSNAGDTGKILASYDFFQRMGISEQSTEIEIRNAIQKLLSAYDVFRTAYLRKEAEDGVIDITAIDALKRDYTTNALGLIQYLDGIKKKKSKDEEKRIIDGGKPDAKPLFDGKDWDTLYRNDELEKVRVSYPDLFDKMKNYKLAELEKNKAYR